MHSCDLLLEARWAGAGLAARLTAPTSQSERCRPGASSGHGASYHCPDWLIEWSANSPIMFFFSSEPPYPSHCPHLRCQLARCCLSCEKDRAPQSSGNFSWIFFICCFALNACEYHLVQWMPTLTYAMVSSFKHGSYLNAKLRHVYLLHWVYLWVLLWGQERGMAGMTYLCKIPQRTWMDKRLFRLLTPTLDRSSIHSHSPQQSITGRCIARASQSAPKLSNTKCWRRVGIWKPTSLLESGQPRVQ